MLRALSLALRHALAFSIAVAVWLAAHGLRAYWRNQGFPDRPGTP